MTTRRKLLIIQDVVTVLFQQSFCHLSENFTGDRSISYVNRYKYILFNKLHQDSSVNLLYRFRVTFYIANYEVL
jgi:hypothetical protein